MNSTNRTQAAFAGIAASTASLTATYFLRGLIHAPFLPEISAQLGVEYSPAGFTRQVIERFGKNDKAVATGVAFIVYFLAGAVLGLFFAAVHRRLPGKNPFARALAFSIVPLFCTGALFAILAILQPSVLAGHSVSSTVLSVIVLNLVFAFVLVWLSDIGEPDRPEFSGSAAARAFARRRFLFAAGIVVATVALAESVSRRLYRSYVQAIGAPSGNLPPFITSNHDFYQISKDLASPRVDENQWRLSVRGNMERPFELSYHDLLQMPMQEQVMTLECISNEVGGPLISNARWRGVPLHLLLERAGLRPGTQEIVLRAVEGYSDSIPVSLAQNNQTLIAVFMNGEKLPVDHGFPARLLVPGLFGMENVKWLNAIEPIAGSYAGFWQQRGWEKFAQVNTMSKFTLPQNGASLAADQPVQLAGVAFAGSRGIRRVEVAAMPASHMEGSSQNLQWSAAELVPGNSEITWVLWKYSWRPPAKPGNYMLLVRATDGTGGLQTAQRAPTFPNGATGYHTVQVQVA